MSTNIDFTINNGNIICNEEIKAVVPNYFYEDETNIYQIKEFIRENIKSLPKNSIININKNDNGRKIPCKDDNIFEKDNNYNVIIDIPQDISILKNIKTGYNIDEIKLNKLSDVDTDNLFLELIEQLKIEHEKYKKIMEEAYIKMIDGINQIAYVFDLKSKDNEGYLGNLKDGVPHGYGKRIRNRENLSNESLLFNYSLYEGNWTNGNFDGYGTLTSYLDKDHNEIEAHYKGFFKNGKKHGQGIYFDSSIGTLEGEFIDNCILGYAKVIYLNGDIYEGEFDFECKHGKGKLTYNDGTIIEGEWIENELVTN